MRQILKLAALRSKRVELAGEVFVCMEPPFAAAQDFSELLKKDRTAAFTKLLLDFVKLEDGKTPAFTKDEARELASGSAQAFMPLFLAITGFADSEKKASPPTSDSATDSPSPSPDQSKN